MSRVHSYYYQVQTQLNVCSDVKYTDFVVWTEGGLAMERITTDKEFYESAADRVEHFFIYGVLPEIIGKWYTRKHVADKDGIVQPPEIEPCQKEAEEPCQKEAEEDPTKSWCYCGEPCYGQMIMCEHKDCGIKWFHFDCLRIRCPPKNKWYCPSCRKLPKVNEKKNKK